MIIQHIPQLAQKRIILASASPRRSELLGNLGLKFEVVTSSFDEKLPKEKFPSADLYAVETAKHKALDVYNLTSSYQPAVDVIISADTVVEHGGLILEKPDDAQHAFEMLSSLSGSSHQVHTGVVLVLPKVADPETGQPPLLRTFASTTVVNFDILSKEAIDAYVKSGEPFGKAGSYGIQGIAGSFVKSLQGCYFNVMGFPVHRFSVEMAKLIQDGYLPLSGIWS